jgi:hypothetical protein
MVTMTEMSRSHHGRISVVISEDAERPEGLEIVYIDVPTARELDREFFQIRNPTVTPTDLEQAENHAKLKAEKLLAEMLT